VSVGTATRDAVAAVRARLAEDDALLLLAVALGIYALFVLVSVVLGLGLNGTANTLERITFLSAVYAMVVLALNLQWGYAGLFNIGVAGFMAVGVYTMAILTGSPTGSPPGLGLPLPVGLVGGMLVAALVGMLAALPALRLRADYLAIVTVALSEIIRLTLLSTTFATFTVAGVTLGTGGGQGIELPTNPVRALFYVDPGNPSSGATGFGSVVFDIFGRIYVPFMAGRGIQPAVVLNWAYAVVLVLFVAGFYWFLTRVGNSPFGRVLKAIREDELVANALGKDTNRFKVKTFAVGCALMGLAGILWQGSQGFVTPGSFVPLVTFFVFIALVVGGPGSNTGSVIGGAVFASLLFEGPNFVRRIVEQLANNGLRIGGLTVGGGGLGATPNNFVDAVAPLFSLHVAPLVAYSLENISSLRLVFLGVVLVYLLQRRPEGLLGHRKEVAAAVDLSRREDGGEAG